MKTLRSLLFLTVIFCSTHGARAQEDVFDTMGTFLKGSAAHGAVSYRISGLLDFEGYYMQQPPPGLIYTDHDFLFNPRLTLFADVQVGPQFYFFAQARVDRGFDPADESLQIRLDEWAVRYTPWSDGRFNVQAGKFATIIGNWANRHDSWENPFITAPLPYENLTSMWDSAPADSNNTLIYWADSEKDLRIPIIWGPAYTTGFAVSGRVGKFDYAADMKNASVSSRPETWDPTVSGFSHPSFSGRIGYRPDEAWNLGFSSSVGPYLMPGASPLTPGTGIGDYRSVLFGQDVSFAWHHWQVWAEVFETRFETPGVHNADTLAYYIEAKYKFTPQLFGAIRWNQEVFNKIPDATGVNYPWSEDIWRIDLAVTYRFTPNMQAKAQYSFMQSYDGYSSGYQSFAALQFTIRF